MRWSTNILDSSINNFNSFTIPKRLENKVDKCFDTKTTLFENDELNVTITSSFFQKTNSDYIKLYVIDSDRRYWSSDVVIEDKEGNDIGIKDIIYEIK
jgi:hypothetical protein